MMMDAATSIASVQHVQALLRTLSLLHVTGSVWPPHTSVSDGASYDFIVVGAGTAGCALAARLSEWAQVLLIEAGEEPPLESHLPAFMLYLKRSHADWNYTSEHDEHTAKCHQQPYFEMSSGKMLGGTSGLSFHNYGRGYPSDFHAWAAAAGDEWTYEKLLPYYKKSEKVISKDLSDSDEHGYDGNIEISVDNRHNVIDELMQAYKEVGHDTLLDVNEHHPLGYAKLPLMISNGARQSSAYSYLRTGRVSENLHIMTNTEVTKILFDDNNNAIGVEAVHEGKKLTIKANKEVILSSGVFHTPKLLMLSGIGPKEELEKLSIKVRSDLPIGKSLQDLVSATVVFITNKTGLPEPLNPTLNPAAPLVGYASLDKAAAVPDYATMQFYIDAEVLLPYCTWIFRYSNTICDDLYKQSIGRKVILAQVIDLNTKSRGQVKLRSANPFDAPIIETNYFGNEEDLNNLAEYVRDFVGVVNSTYFRSNGVKVAGVEAAGCGGSGAEFWRCYVSCMMSGMSYFSGTAPLGTALDPALRVRGVGRLRAVDAAAAPAAVRTNPSMTVVMMAERAADIIKEHYNIH